MQKLSRSGNCARYYITKNGDPKNVIKALDSTFAVEQSRDSLLSNEGTTKAEYFGKKYYFAPTVTLDLIRFFIWCLQLCFFSKDCDCFFAMTC